MQSRGNKKRRVEGILRVLRKLVMLGEKRENGKQE